MSRIIVFHHLAEQDLDALVEYVEQDSPQAAERLLDAAWETFTELAEMPYLSRERSDAAPRWPGLRSWAIRGFPRFLIFYRPSADRIEIVRIVHGA